MEPQKWFLTLLPELEQFGSTNVLANMSTAMAGNMHAAKNEARLVGMLKNMVETHVFQQGSNRTTFNTYVMHIINMVTRTHTPNFRISSKAIYITLSITIIISIQITIIMTIISDQDE